MKPLSLGAVALLTTLAIPTSGIAQAPPAQLPDSVTRMVRQLQSLEERLGPIEQMTLAAAPELTQRSNAIQLAVVERMLELYPSLADGMERLLAMEDEKQAAMLRADIPRVETLMARGAALNDSLQAARDQALQDEELTSELRAYQEALVARMIAVDPSAEAIIEEMRSLSARIDAADVGGGL